MLRLRALEVRGYRAFAGWTRLELRPLTLVYGRNNAGKSSLLRLLAILADSMQEDAHSALELRGNPGRGSKFKDLPWMGDGVPRNAFRMRLRWEDDGVAAFTDEFELAWLDERSRAVVRALVIRGGSDEILLSADALPFPDEDRYIVGDDDDATVTIRWNGLRPRLEQSPTVVGEEIVDGLAKRMLSLRRSVSWLDSNRPRPPRLVAAQDTFPTALEHDGRNALEFLAADRELLNAIHPWFSRPPIERDLRLKPAGDGFVSPVLGSTRSAAEFHLLSAGEGMAHVLPVLVGAALIARGTGYRVFAVEEPESHLHGDAQRSLARHLAQLAASDDPPIMLLETHSRALLLGVQLAIAEGIMPAEHGQVVWREQEPTGASTLSQIEFTKDGGLRGWPRSALADEAKMVRELLDQQDERLAG